MKRLRVFIVLFLGTASCTFAQMPVTDIHFIKLRKEGDSLLATKCMSISPQTGYNNQPSFSLDEKSIYFSSSGNSKQTEIWCFDLRKKKTRQVTYSAISEYSPQEIQAGYIHAVTVEADSSQKIHLVDATTGLHQQVLNIDSVGYYCFLNQDSLVYYKLTEPHSLRLYSISGNSEVWLGDLPARGFKAINRHALIYALKDSGHFEIMIYDFALQKAKTVTFCSTESEDYFWHSELGILRSEKSKIYRWNTRYSSWDPLLDLSSFGIKTITRFAFDKNLKHLVVINKSG